MIIVKLIGGLGNQMFQYAAAYALAKRTGDTLKIDNLYYRDHSKRSHRFFYRPFALNLFNLSSEIASAKEIVKFTLPRIFNKYIYHALKLFWREKNIWTEEDLELYLHNKNDFPANGCYLSGFFQRYSLISNNIIDIKKEFQFKDEIEKDSLNIANEIKSSNNPICVVFRRGDYVGHPFLDITKMEFYYKALEFFIDKENDVFVFSDDIPWCKENFKPDRFNVKFVDQRHTGVFGGNYLQLMMLCHNFIIPNSTYPYWAALLCPFEDKVVIAPKIWYKGQDQNIRNSILPPDWIAL